MDDREFLDRYCRDEEQEAFAELVRRHGGWIYSSARRQLRDAHLAEDVTQAVFLLLARKAAGISARSSLGGWLFGTLRYCIKEARRQRSRQLQREKEAAQMRQDLAPSPAPDAAWEEVSPILDDAIARLGKSDREAILLRFYQCKPLADVGQALGTSEEAARKRVDRAVEKLREKLAAKGVEAQALSLSALVLAHAVEAGPVGLVEKVTASVGQGVGGSTAGGIAMGAAKMMVLVKLKVALAIALVCGLGVAASQVVGAPGSPAAAAPTAPAAVSFPALSDRRTAPIPGDSPRYGNWEFVLTEQAGKALLAACRNESPGQSGYALYRGTLSQIHPVLNQAWASGAVINAGNDDHVRFEPTFVVPMAARQMGGRTPDGWQVNLQRTGDMHLPVTRTAAGFGVAVKDLRVQAERWNPQNGSSRKWTGTLSLSAEVGPGEVILAVQEISFGTGAKVFHVLGWECFQATGAQYARITASRWRGQPWFSRLPADLRALADAAYTADAKLPGPATTRIIKLKNGVTARLMAVGNPAEHPLIAWNPDGGKTLWDWQGCLNHLSDQQGFMGVLELYDTNAIPQALLASDNYIENDFEKTQHGFTRWYALRVAEGDAAAGQLRFAVAAGPWTEVGPIEIGGQVVFEGVTVRMPQKPQILSEGCTIPVVSRTREWEFSLTVTTRDNETIEGTVDQWPSKFVTGTDDGGGFYFTRFPIPADQIAAYTLRARKVEWATFDNVAAHPAAK